MFIRYQVVRNVSLVLGAASVIAVCAGGGSDTPDVAVAPKVTSPPASKLANVEVTDAVIIAAAEKTVPDGKVKDAFQGKTAVKVNIYDDNGDGVADRLKVDRNRDEVWDESWTRKAGLWERGDGTVWRDGAWVGAVAAPAPVEAIPQKTPATPAATGVEALQLEVARVILEGKASGDKLKDYTRGRGPKFNLYDDDKDGRWDRAKADYDRDDTWDESWTRKGESLERKDEKTNGILVLDGGAWKAK